jgi:hypothetical protein
VLSFLVSCSQATNLEAKNSNTSDGVYPTFEVYMVKGVDANTALKMPLDNIPLEVSALVTSVDKEYYYWDGTMLNLQTSLFDKKENKDVVNKPFVLIINGKRVYCAVFLTHASSANSSEYGVFIDPTNTDFINIYTKK